MKTKRIIPIAVLAIGTTIFTMACFNSTIPENNGTESYTITMQNSTFSPASLTIVAGSRVTWMNDDNVIHAIITADTSINTGDIAPTASYSAIFNTVRTYNYYDAHNTNMAAVLTVTRPGAGGGY